MLRVKRTATGEKITSLADATTIITTTTTVELIMMIWLLLACRRRAWLNTTELRNWPSSVCRHWLWMPRWGRTIQSKLLPSWGLAECTTPGVARTAELHGNAVVTCEIKSFQNYSGLRRCPTEIISLKLFQNCFGALLQLVNIFQHVLFNVAEIILKYFQTWSCVK